MRRSFAAMALVALCAPASAGPLQDANKAIVSAFFDEVLSQGHLDRYAQSHASDFVVHTGEGDLPLSADIAAAAEERKAVPDLRMNLKQVVAEGDMVTVLWTATGTNTGDGMGFHATGAKFVVPGSTYYRLKDGKIVEEWSVWDMATVYRQAGMCPK